ncbi:MAG: T9SS type A sorting domain-containing protein [Bacteroidota bacterium]
MILFLNFDIIAEENEKGRYVPREWKLQQILEAQGKTNNPGASLLESDENTKISKSNEVESEVHAAINPNDTNNIIVSPIRQGGAEGLYCPIYFTTDFGASWQESSFKALPKGEGQAAGGGDPILVFDDNGRAHLSWIHLWMNGQIFQADTIIASLYYAYSDDGGTSWNEDPEYITETRYHIDMPFAPQFSLKQMSDKQWMCADRSDAESKNYVYTTVTEIDMSGSSEDYNIMLHRLKPGDTEFESNIVNANQYDMLQFSTCAVDNNGRLHVMFYGKKGGNAVYYTYSDDGGANFIPEIKISDFHSTIPVGEHGNAPDSIKGITNQRFYPAPMLTCDNSGGPNGGNLYAVWTADGIDQKESNGYDIYLSRSTDRGETWQQPIIVNDDQKGVRSSQFYPSITVNGRGVVIISWYDRRMDESDLLTEYYISYSFDGGETFPVQMPVSSAASDFTSIGARNNGFGIGEYNQLLATDYYAIPVWGDGRDNQGDVSIYTAFVPISEGVSSVDEIKPVNSSVSIRSISPQPANGQIELRLSLKHGSAVDVSFYNINGGKLPYGQNWNLGAGEHNMSINTSMLKAGSYYLKVLTSSGYALKKFIITR